MNLFVFTLRFQFAFASRLLWLEMSFQVRKITDSLLLGEGPHWDAREQALYFVSILEKTLHKYVPATGVHTKTSLDGRPGFIVPVEGTPHQFLVGVERKLLVVQWDGEERSKVTLVKEVGEVDKDSPNNRFNDGKADPRGRVFAGTMGHEPIPGDVEKEKGSLFRIDGRGITKVAEKIGISNGLAWDVAAKAMYYIDSPEVKIRKYDYDVETGEISNMQCFYDLIENGNDGFPDGMTIDTAGDVYVATFGGSCVLQLSPKGQLVRKIPIPASQVTSCTFGGPNYDILFVTTSAFMNKEGEGIPEDGCTFMVTGLGATGLPNINFKY